ncbi:CBS domain-containing protein CBSX5-like [Andrographis paniculata]|uniref:CBS domain-containing protein CBSX5-like n=1 Tax=Andrographis paniculata TaxID=175694 RepID=UPI0021E9A2F3|nr:CBS domain-containing protein CBSX5-like [Andrographis paniculata]
MAVRLLNAEVSDLCLGKPELICVAANASIADALAKLRASEDTHVGVWVCSGEIAGGSCRCVGKFSVADVTLFLCREENLADPFKALQSPVSDVLPKGLSVVRHLESNSSLWEAIGCILEGAQNLVVPIHSHLINNTSRKRFLNRQQSPSSCVHNNGRLYCWLTQEDVVRFLFNFIGVFSPIPTQTVESLGIIDPDVMAVAYNKPASSALEFFERAIKEQRPVAVMDEENRLIGEISPVALACCDETAAATIMALPAVDLMAHIDCGGTPLDLVQLVKMKLKESNLEGMLELMDEFRNSLTSPSSSSSCSSDDESSPGKGSWSCKSRNSPGRRSEAISCSPGSSLAAVMIQALSNRVSSVWVVEEDQTLAGIIPFTGILRAFLSIPLGKPL